MNITESKLRAGSFTLTPGAGTEFETACQTTSLVITPEYDEVGDPVEVLCGDKSAASLQRSDTLKITAIQDFDDPEGFVAWTWDHDMETVEFTFLPSGATGPTFAGQVQVKAVEVGGEVGQRITTEAEWSCVGAVSKTYPAPGGKSAKAAADKV